MTSESQNGSASPALWPPLSTNRSAIEELCRAHHVRRLAVFGSATTSCFDPNRSDVDLLVEFDPDRRSRRFEDYFGLKEGLEALLGRPVELVTPEALANPFFAASVTNTEAELYVA